MGFRVSLKNNRLLKPVGAETVNTVSLLAAVCDTLSAAYHLLFSAGLSECRFSVPAPISGGVVSLTLRKKRLSQNHIPSSRSFSCNRHLGSKKAGTSMCADQYKRIDLSLAVLVSQWCNRLWDSKSKLSVTLVCCRQFKAVFEAAVFPFRIPQACTVQRRTPKFCEDM